MTAVPDSLLVDTDILVDCLRGIARARDFLVSREERLLVSVVSVAELHAGIRAARERRPLQELLELFVPCEVTVAIAQAAGGLRAKYGRSHGTGLADALIGATALELGFPLATGNRKHFPFVRTVGVR